MRKLPDIHTQRSESEGLPASATRSNLPQSDVVLSLGGSAETAAQSLACGHRRCSRTTGGARSWCRPCTSTPAKAKAFTPDSGKAGTPGSGGWWQTGSGWFEESKILGLLSALVSRSLSPRASGRLRSNIESALWSSDSNSDQILPCSSASCKHFIMHSSMASAPEVARIAGTKQPY